MTVFCLSAAAALPACCYPNNTLLSSFLPAASGTGTAAPEASLQHPVLLILILLFTLGLAVRVYLINKMAIRWNRDLDIYIQRWTYSNCMSYQAERNLYKKEFYPDYKDYLNLFKWHLGDFVKDHFLIVNVRDHLNEVNNKESVSCVGERAPKHD